VLSTWFFHFPVASAQSFEGDKQPIKVTGQVLDENNEPVIGASVVIDGTNIGTATDFDGNYTLDAWLGAVLKVTNVGNETVKTMVCGNVMNFRLLPERIFQFFPLVPIANLSMNGPYIYGHVYDNYSRPLPGPLSRQQVQQRMSPLMTVVISLLMHKRETLSMSHAHIINPLRELLRLLNLSFVLTQSRYTVSP